MVPLTPLNEAKQKSIEEPCGKNCFLLGQRQGPVRSLSLCVPVYAVFPDTLPDSLLA
jgi:hypothetical protein